MNSGLHKTSQSLRPRLQLVPPRALRRSPLALWHLLSLDAPTVATLWTFFFARSANVTLRWQSPAAMFVAVWMLYVADRLLDARHTTDLEERHHFHQRHRTALLTAVALAAVVLVLLLNALPAATLHLYALLATLLGAWLLLIHTRPSAGLASRRLPKELAVGLFFPAAACIPTVAHAPELRLLLLAPAIAFATVCTLNCLFLYAWEHPGPRSFAHLTTCWATRHLKALAAIAVAIFTAVTLFVAQTSITLYPITACALSTLLLLALHDYRQRLAPVHLRALADVTLLTPLLLLPFLR